MITAYQPAWKTAFEKIAVVLKAALHDIPVDIQHVGSTAIPGLAAKPILDIDIIIHKKELLMDIEEKLIALGYTSRGTQGIDGRYAFRQSTSATPHDKNRTIWMPHHLYVCYTDSLALKNHLLFRNALLNDPILLKKYSILKHSLVKNTNISRIAYSKMKTDFILSVLANAGLSKEEIASIQEANE